MWDIRLKEGWAHLPTTTPFPRKLLHPGEQVAWKRSSPVCLQPQGKTQTEQEGVTTAHSSEPAVKQTG